MAKVRIALTVGRRASNHAQRRRKLQFDGQSAAHMASVFSGAGVPVAHTAPAKAPSGPEILRFFGMHSCFREGLLDLIHG